MAAGEKDVLQRSEEKQLSAASEEFEDESLDPRVQVELEKLNKASDDINKLELELDEARASFRQVLTESTQKLNALSKKLGGCIEKARCYYDARMKAKEAQIQTQNVALRFERACSQQMAAKEMVYLAEQGFFKKGQPFDPAWQEMLNHATMKVNEAERERLESEIAHQVTARIFNECEQRVKYLQKDLKRNIAKSRPYFEQKAKFNQTMEEQKRLVGSLEQAVADSKMMYSEALRNLERISDEIHQQRKDAQLRKEMGTRGAGVGAETPHPPPVDGAAETHGEPAPDRDPLSGHIAVNRTNSETQTDVEAPEGGESSGEGSDEVTSTPSSGGVQQGGAAGGVSKASSSGQGAADKDNVIGQDVSETSTSNQGNQAGNQGNQVGNQGNHAGNQGNQGNHAGNQGNHTGNQGNHTGNQGNHASNRGNHAGNQGNHAGNQGNHAGNQGNHSGNQGNHTSISDTRCTDTKEQVVNRAPAGAQTWVAPAGAQSGVPHTPAGAQIAAPQSLFKKPLPVHDKPPVHPLHQDRLPVHGDRDRQHGDRDRQHLTVDDSETVSDAVSSTEMLTPGSGPSSLHTTAVTSPDTEHEPDAHTDSTRTNMEVMETLQKAKNFRSPFLRPNRSRDDLLEEGLSDNESIPGSMASVSVLDDDQIESLMMETGDFVNFLATQDEHEAEKIKSMTLPAKLSYLSNYMSFKPEFSETNGAEGGDGGSGDNDSADYGAPSGGHLGGSSDSADYGAPNGGHLGDSSESGEALPHKLSEPQTVIDSKEYDACWSCDIDTNDVLTLDDVHLQLHHDAQMKLSGDAQMKLIGDALGKLTADAQMELPGDAPGSAPGVDTTPHQGAPPVSTSQPAGDKPRCRGYSFEEDSEFQRVYKELSGFENLLRSSSSEESPPPQSPLFLQPSDPVAANEESVTITVTAAESSPECQKDPLGVMPIKCVGAISSRNVPNGKSASSEKPVDNVEHFV